MVKKKKIHYIKKRKKRWVVFLLFFLFLILFMGGCWTRSQLPKRLSTELKDNITSVLDPFDQNLYDIEAERVKADAFYQNVTIPYISVKPKAHVFDSAGFAEIPKTIFRFTIKNAELSTDGLISAIRRNEKLKFSEVLFPDIAVTVYQNPGGQNIDDSQDSTTIESVKLKNLELQIKEFLNVPLQDTAFTLFAFSNMTAKGEISAKLQQGDSIPQLNFKDQIFSATDLLFQNFDDIYNLSVDSFYYDNQISQLDLKGINVKPRFDNDEVISKIQWQTDIIRTRISSLSFYPFSLADVINQKQLFLDHIDIKGGIIDVFRDRTLPFDTLKRPPMPVERIMNAPLTLKLDTISIENIDVVYTELPENAEEAGEVPFRNLKADLFNMTNQRQAIQSDSLMRIEAEAFVFGSALLKADFVYDLTSDRGVYNADGSLSDFDMDIINPAVFPLTGLKILSGDHRETSFSYQGDNNHTSGQVEMVYQNLEINLLPGKADILSQTANWAGKNLVYYAENPLDGEELRIGEIDFERNKTRFVFHYWWKSYYSGIKDTAMRENIITGD